MFFQYADFTQRNMQKKASSQLSSSSRNLNSTLKNTLLISLSTNKCASIMFTYHISIFSQLHRLYRWRSIPFITEYNYLGILLDSWLIWNRHIKILHSTAFFALNIIKLLSSVYCGGGVIWQCFHYFTNPLFQVKWIINTLR